MNPQLAHPDEEDSSEGEDLIGEDTPSEETDSHTHASPTPSPPSYQQPVPPIPPFEQAYPQQQNEPEPTSTLRSRTTTSREQREELFSSSATTTGISPRSTQPPVSVQTTKETLLTHNRTEQEALTSSLLSMASALKDSSKAFSASLDDEKDVLDYANKGMDKNTEGLGSAYKKMGELRGVSRGSGWSGWLSWIGPILLYVRIGGLMVVAVLIVFVMPKLRF